jgi:N-acetyl-gamma-glutamyl-phosphate reductase
MNVGVVGASGYAGGELLRLLSGHPEFKVVEICAGSNAGELITTIHPNLTNYTGKSFAKVDVVALNKCELVFLALPHGESQKLISEFDSKLKVVDLGADYRLEDKTAWDKYYGGTYAGVKPYGLPELVSKDIYKNESVIANPGCYATAIALGAAPLLKLSAVDTSDVVVVAASGTTGAGRSAKVNLLGSEVMNNMSSYKFGGVHQHTPEIEQILKKIGGHEIIISFTPILAPMPRGILATITCKINGSITQEDLDNAFTTQYDKSSFVHYLKNGALPSTAAVYGSNNVQISAAIDEHAKRVVVSVSIDNLGKGAAGQAIQNANLMFGLAENLGLTQLGAK